MPGTRPCPQCQASVPLKVRHCPACSALVNPHAPEDPIKVAREAAELKSMVLWGIGGMLLFFSFGFFLPAMVADIGFIWVSAALFVIGVVLVTAGLVVRERLKKDIARLEEELHVRCKYCGGLNDRDLHRCAFCGAPL